MKTILENHTLFKKSVAQSYTTHPVGSLLLALEIYEGCRNTKDGLFWHIMGTQGDSWTAESFHNAAKEILEIVKDEQ